MPERHMGVAMLSFVLGIPIFVSGKWIHFCRCSVNFFLWSWKGSTIIINFIRKSFRTIVLNWGYGVPPHCTYENIAFLKDMP